MKLIPSVRADLLAAIRLARSPAAQISGGTSLEEFLYTTWFARAGGTDHLYSRPNDGTGRPEFVARLRAAHAASAQLEPGWTARRVGRGGAVLAERAGEYLDVRPPDYVNLDHLAAPVRVGDALAVSARRDATDREGGWWITSGPAGHASAGALIRVYWNCPPQSAAPLVARLTRELDEIGFTYTMKCPTTEALFDRVEPVVLYLGVAEWAAAKGTLRGVHASLSGLLRVPVPPLTLKLGPGAAAAEDPADGWSFGQSRARAVATGLARAAELRLTDEPATLAVVVSQLSAHGISPLRPYLREGSPPDLVTGW
jgi:HopA1 effector protein family